MDARKILTALTILLFLSGPVFAEPLRPDYNFKDDAVFREWELNGPVASAHDGRFVRPRFGRDLLENCQGGQAWNLVALVLFDTGGSDAQVAVMVTRLEAGQCESVLDYAAVDIGFVERGIPSGDWRVIKGTRDAVGPVLADLIVQGMQRAMASSRLLEL